MTETSRHCPFLNRSDPRCAQNLSLDNLKHAFDHCMGEYADCPMYGEMLTERQSRRALVIAAAAPVREMSPFVPMTVNRRLARSA